MADKPDAAPFEKLFDAIKAATSPYGVTAFLSILLLVHPSSFSVPFLIKVIVCLVTDALCLFFAQTSYTGSENQQSRQENVRFAAATAFAGALLVAFRFLDESDNKQESINALMIGAAVLIHVVGFALPMLPFRNRKFSASDFNAFQFALISVALLCNASALVASPSPSDGSILVTARLWTAVCFLALWLLSLHKWRQLWREPSAV